MIEPLNVERTLDLLGSSYQMNGPSLAHRTYETFASTYDAFFSDEDHEYWLPTLETIAREHNLPGRRLLDVACGTGLSAAPMVARGYDVSACDISPAMLRRAGLRLERAGGYTRLDVADMRNLPDWGRFDLVTCLCDAVNYLLDLHDLDAAFASAASRLKPGGLYIFDTNSLSTYRTIFTGSFTCEAEDVRFHWHGVHVDDPTPGRIYTSRFESLSSSGSAVHVHVQRHWPVELVRERLERAGLRCVSAIGQTSGTVISGEPDESRFMKVVFVARRDRE